MPDTSLERTRGAQLGSESTVPKITGFTVVAGNDVTPPLIRSETTSRLDAGSDPDTVGLRV